MLLRLIDKIPFVQCLTFFPIRTHKAALKKFTVLWILTSLPVIAAAMLSAAPTEGQPVGGLLLERLTESISVSEQFVYTAAFIAPILYIIYEKYKAAEDSGSSEPLKDSFHQVFRGYGFVVTVALLVMFFTAIAFGAIKTSTEVFESTFLHFALLKGAPLIYLFSLYCWYLTLLDGLISGSDFVERGRQGEADIAARFSAAIKRRGVSND